MSALPLAPEDQDRRKWRKAPPKTRLTNTDRDGDVLLLIEYEQRLADIEVELEDLEDELAEANDVAAEAEAAWTAHVLYWTLKLHEDGIKSNEDLRRAYAMAHRADIGAGASTGTPGAQLYREHVATKSVVATLTAKLKAHPSRISSLQTLIAGLRHSTGLKS